MGDDAVTKRECEIMHNSMDERLDKIDANFAEVFKKLDAIARVNGKVEFIDARVDAIGRKYDSHIDGHSKFISVSLGIIALASTVVTVILVLMRK